VKVPFRYRKANSCVADEKRWQTERQELEADLSKLRSTNTKLESVNEELRTRIELVEAEKLRLTTKGAVDRISSSNVDEAVEKVNTVPIAIYEELVAKYDRLSQDNARIAYLYQQSRVQFRRNRDRITNWIGLFRKHRDILRTLVPNTDADVLIQGAPDGDILEEEDQMVEPNIPEVKALLVPRPGSSTQMPKSPEKNETLPIKAKTVTTPIDNAFDEVEDSQPLIISPAATQAPRSQARQSQAVQRTPKKQISQAVPQTVLETPQQETIALDWQQESFSPTERAICGSMYQKGDGRLKRTLSFDFDSPTSSTKRMRMATQSNMAKVTPMKKLQTSVNRKSILSSPIRGGVQVVSSPMGLAAFDNLETESYDLDAAESMRLMSMRNFSSSQIFTMKAPERDNLLSDTSSHTVAANEALNSDPPEEVIIPEVELVDVEEQNKSAAEEMNEKSTGPRHETTSIYLDDQHGLTPRPNPARPPLTGDGIGRSVKNKIGSKKREPLTAISTNTISTPRERLQQKVLQSDTDFDPKQDSPALGLVGSSRKKPSTPAMDPKMKSTTPSSSAAGTKTVQTRLNLSSFKFNPQHPATIVAAENMAEHHDGVQQTSLDQVIRRKLDRKCLAGCTKPSCCGDTLRKAIEIGGLPLSPKTGARGGGLQWCSQSSSNPLPEDTQAAEDALIRSYLGVHHAADLDIAALPASDRRELLLQAQTKRMADSFGRHRSAHANAVETTRPPTPPGFWRTGFPTTQEHELDRRAADELNEKRVWERTREAGQENGRWVIQ
jgi:hypothetical protein